MDANRYSTGRVVAAISLIGAAWLPAAAITGKVVDPDGKPIAGANACLIVDGALGLCVETNAEGMFDLVDSDVPRLRVSAAGFLSRYLPAVTHEEPIELTLGATLRVKLIDASTGEPLEEGTVVLDFPSGRRLGPYPVNRAGFVIRPVRPEEVMVTAQADGYRPAAGRNVRLTGGEESAVTIELEPVAESPDREASPDT